LNILTLSDHSTHKQVEEVILKIGINFHLINFVDFKSFLTSDEPIPEIAIIGPGKVSDTKMLLLELVSKTPRIPTVVIVKKSDFGAEIQAELIKAGALGISSDDNLGSISQHIVRISIAHGLVESDFNDSYAPEILQYIIDSNDSLLSVINQDNRYEVVNEAFSQKFSRNKEELIGVSPAEIWGHEIFEDKIKLNLERCLNGEIVRYKAYFDLPGITGKCYEVIYRPYYPGKGKRKFSIVETRDITDIESIKKEVEDIRQKNFYFEKYLPIGVFECSTDGKILTSNDTFRNILELDEDDEINLLSFFNSDHRFTDYLDSIKAGEASTFSQLKMETAKGNDIFVRISSHARSDSEKNIIVNATLEDNTREVLLERKLTMTNRMETLGTLAGGIAHDFNTILTTISGYTELTIQEADEDSPVRDYMTKLSSATSKAESVINQMLTFSKQITHEKISVKIEKVFREAMQFVRTALPYNIYLEEETSSINGYILADPTQLFRVFLNIATNSIQAMERDGGILGASLRESLIDSRRFAEVEFRDTGPGIEKSILDRIYEPFFTTKETGKGTGMGLSVAHGIITELGGDIIVESSPGKGATFVVRLPVYLENDLMMPENQETGRTVLYADDNIHFSRTISIALESLGYQVLLASSYDDLHTIINAPDSKIDIYFIRYGFDNQTDKNLLDNLFRKLTGSKIVVILKPGSSIFNDFARNHRGDVFIIHEPVSLRDILNVIHENC